MEMCYDGALVMPSSYAVMSEDEMTYVDGGVSKKQKACIIAACVAAGVALGVAIAAGQIALGARLMGLTIKSYTKKLGAKAVANVISKSFGWSLKATLAVVAFVAIL